MENATSLTELSKNVFEANAALKKAQEAHKQEILTLTANLKEANRLYEISLAGIDVGKALLAEKILYKRGTYTGDGEQPSVIRDFIEWVATGKGQYYNPQTGYYGTKNYDRWSSQREDHSYGSGPRHGSTNFALGLHPDFRSKPLSDDEKDAVIYYLGNITTIEQKKAA